MPRKWYLLVVGVDLIALCISLVCCCLNIGLCDICIEIYPVVTWLF